MSKDQLHCRLVFSIHSDIHNPTSVATYFNPLVTNDAYMCPILNARKCQWCIYVSKVKVCALTTRSAATSGQCLWAFQCKPSSPLSTFWLHFCHPWPLARRENKCQTFYNCLTSLPTCNSLRLVVHTSLLHVTTYVPIFLFSSSEQASESFQIMWKHSSIVIAAQLICYLTSLRQLE